MSSRLKHWLPTNLTIHYPFVSEQSSDVLSPRRLAANSAAFWLDYSSAPTLRVRWLSATDCLSSYSLTGCLSSYSSLLRKHNSIHCVGNGIRNQLLHSSVNNRLPSRCLGMDAPSICSIGKSVTIWTILNAQRRWKSRILRILCNTGHYNPLKTVPMSAYITCRVQKLSHWVCWIEILNLICISITYSAVLSCIQLLFNSSSSVTVQNNVSLQSIIFQHNVVHGIVFSVYK
jgi:hypothetical protein